MSQNEHESLRTWLKSKPWYQGYVATGTDADKVFLSMIWHDAFQAGAEWGRKQVTGVMPPGHGPPEYDERNPPELRPPLWVQQPPKIEPMPWIDAEITENKPDEDE